MPDAGSQPSHKAKITISTIPSQKLGMLAPKSDASALSRSSSELRRAADSTPSAMPPSVESSRALAARTTVAWQRLVEAELGAQPRDVLVGGLRPEHDLGGIAGRDVEDGEDDERHAKQDRADQEEPAEEEERHAARAT